jgi:acyl carrier protein
MILCPNAGPVSFLFEARWGIINVMPNSPNAHEDAVALQIVAMLARILAKPSVSADDDFFELGGDSLTATELMVAIEAQYGVVVDPVEVFEEPNIRKFARMIAELSPTLRSVTYRVVR